MTLSLTEAIDLHKELSDFLSNFTNEQIVKQVMVLGYSRLRCVKYLKDAKGLDLKTAKDIVETYYVAPPAGITFQTNLLK